MSRSAPALESASAEPLRVVLQTRSDPTGAAVEFQVSSGARSSPSGVWVAGSWDGTWSNKTGRVAALSPTIGAAGSLVVVEGTDYLLWIRYSVSVVKRCGLFLVR